MCQIKRVDAFALVAKTLDKGDLRTANEMMQIISRSLLQNKKASSISATIEITDKKALRLFKDLIEGKELIEAVDG